MPKFGVILPVYNVENYLAFCLESLLKQKADIQIYIVDDCSTDKSSIIAQDYAKTYDNIKYIKNQKNLGLGLSRKAGLNRLFQDDIAVDYIHFLDSDDWMEDDAYEKLSNAIEKSNHSDVIHFQYNEVSDITGETVPVLYKNKNALNKILNIGDIDEILDNNDRHAWCKIYKSDFLKNNDIIFNDYPCYEDMEMNVSVIRHLKSIFFSDEILLNYRVKRKGSLLEKSIRHNKCAVDSLNTCIKLFDDFDPTVRNKVIASEFINTYWILHNCLSDYKMPYQEVQYYFRMINFEKIDKNYILPYIYNDAVKIRKYSFFMNKIRTVLYNIKNAVINPNSYISKMIFLVSILFFLKFGISNVIFHMPWFDEANAWNISRNLSFLEYFQITKHEGHTFLWYLILMPFAKNDFFYPYSMLIVNFIICLGAVLLLWRYAPFNSFLKCFITFSFPLKIFSSCARCYGLTVLLLFLCCSMFKDRLKHPLIYALIITVCANTSLMGIIWAFWVGVVFMWDIFQSYKDKLLTKKDFILSFLILFLGVLLLLVQFVGFVKPFYTASNSGFDYNNFLSFYITCTFKAEEGFRFFETTNYCKLFTNFFHLLCVILLFKFCIKNKRAFFIGIASILSLLFLFFHLYGGDLWHFAFLYVYLIGAMWIYLSENQIETKFQKIYYGLFILFTLGIFLQPFDYTYIQGRHGYLKSYLIENKAEFQDANLFFFPTYSYAKEITPYFWNKGYRFYDSLGNPIESLESQKLQWTTSDINFYKIEEKIKKTGNKKNYLIWTTKNQDNFKRSTEFMPDDLRLEFVIFVFPAYIYKLERT